jgi:hypothetical protein
MTMGGRSPGGAPSVMRAPGQRPMGSVGVGVQPGGHGGPPKPPPAPGGGKKKLKKKH